MDKIYSRKRIRIPSFKKRKYNKITFIIFTILIIIIVSVCVFIFMSYPILIASCKTAASSKANNIVFEKVKEVMDCYTYNDLIDIEKDVDGNVSLIKANTILINKINAQIISNIQKEIDNTPRISVYINYGTISRNKYFKIYWS